MNASSYKRIGPLTTACEPELAPDEDGDIRMSDDDEEMKDEDGDIAMSDESNQGETMDKTLPRSDSCVPQCLGI